MSVVESVGCATVSLGLLTELLMNSPTVVGVKWRQTVREQWSASQLRMLNHCALSSAHLRSLAPRSARFHTHFHDSGDRDVTACFVATGVDTLSALEGDFPLTRQWYMYQFLNHHTTTEPKQIIVLLLYCLKQYSILYRNSYLIIAIYSFFHSSNISHSNIHFVLIAQSHSYADLIPDRTSCKTFFHQTMLLSAVLKT